jgi:hypothetical protein
MKVGENTKKKLKLFFRCNKTAFYGCSVTNSNDLFNELNENYNENVNISWLLLSLSND